MLRIADVYNMIDGFAPFALAEEWDNVGILAGSESACVESVLCALDLNDRVLDEAIDIHVQLIVTHHPIMFRGRKNLREDDAEGRLLCRLIRSGIGLIAAHTSFDNAEPGVNDALAEILCLSDVRTGENGMRSGIPMQDTLGGFLAFAQEKLDAPIRCYGEKDRSIHSVSVLGGAGGDFAMDALKAGSDVYLTGEIAHHKAWDAYANGICVLEAGHAATELPAVKLLADSLQNAANGVQYNLRVFFSEVGLFR